MGGVRGILSLKSHWVWTKGPLWETEPGINFATSLVAEGTEHETKCSP